MHPYHFDARHPPTAVDLIAVAGESNEEGHVNFITDRRAGSHGYVFSRDFSDGRWFDQMQHAMREVLREMDRPGFASVAVHRVKIPE